MSASQTLLNLSEISLGVVCPMANESDSAVAFVEEVLETCNRYAFKSLKFFAVVDHVSSDHTRDLLDAQPVTTTETRRNTEVAQRKTKLGHCRNRECVILKQARYCTMVKIDP